MPSCLHRHPILRLLPALAVLASLLLPASAAAAPKDPVLRAINAARASDRITPATATELRRDWAASARAARGARNASRRAAVVSVRRYTTLLAIRGALNAERLRPVMLSVRATTWTMLHGSFPSHEEELQIPGEVVVFTYYSGRGVQFQPFETFKQGLRELNQREPDTEAARAIADRMLELSVRRGTSIVWEYYFPFGGPSSPWTSAISQAVATEFLHRVGLSVPDAERAPYATAAEEVTRSFLRSTGVGGVGTPQGKGRYYVMYSFLPRQRILNGHLQVLINVNRYAAGSGSTAARQVVELGVRGLLPLLPKFDTGAWSNYQPGQEAELSYHSFQSEQLVKLGDETGNATFVDYGTRFSLYTVTPPTIGFPSTLYRAIFPAADAFRDDVSIPVTLDKRARVTLIVVGPDGEEVWRDSTYLPRGSHSIRWDGTDATGRRAPAGEYSGRLVATDVAGNRADVDLEAPIRVIADVTAPALRLVTMRERRGTTIITAGAFDMASGWITARLRVDGRIIAAARGPRAGTILLRTKVPVADVRRGQLVLTDTSGNELVHPLGG